MFSRADHGMERPAHPSHVDGRRRVVVAAVRPEIDGGRWPVKRVVGDVLEVEADLLIDGHDILAARVLYRHETARAWSEQPLAPLGNDRWRALLPLPNLGRWLYTVESWVDEWASFVWGLRRKVDAGNDVTVELMGAAALTRAIARRWRWSRRCRRRWRAIPIARRRPVMSASSRWWSIRRARASRAGTN